MRKLLLFVGLATVSATFAQKAEKLEDVVEKIKKEKYDEAKEKLDKVLADPKSASNADAMYYKAVVYHNLAKQKQDSAMSLEALGAMKTYIKAEESKPEAQRMLLSTLDNHRTLFDIYTEYNKRGVENFQKQTYASAYYNFDKALEVFDILSQRGITTVKFDTTTNIYAGYSAQNAKMYVDAARYYDKLININLNDTSYIAIYHFMIQNNLQNKDTASAKRYLAISQERFPQFNDTWLEYQTQFLSNDKTKRFDEYEKIVKANPRNEVLAMNYASELYSQLRSSTNVTKDSALIVKTENALTNVLAINPNSLPANLLLSQINWLQFYPLQDQIDNIKGTFPEAMRKKKELNSKIDAVFEKANPYWIKLDETYSKLTDARPQDKANHKIVLNQMVEYYKRRKQNDKVAQIQKKINSL